MRMLYLFFPSHSFYLIISAETGDNVAGLGDEQKVVHTLQGLTDAMTTAIAALGLTRIVWGLSRAAFHLRVKSHETFQQVQIKIRVNGGLEKLQRRVQSIVK